MNINVRKDVAPTFSAPRLTFHQNADLIDPKTDSISDITNKVQDTRMKNLATDFTVIIESSGGQLHVRPQY